MTIDTLISAPLKTLNLSATIAINQRSNALLDQGTQIFKLGLGQSPFPVPEHVTHSLIEHAGEKDYLPVLGLPALRQAITDYLYRRYGIDRSATGVIVGPGSKELMFLLQLVQQSKLTLPSPSWVSYYPQAKLLGKDVDWVKTHIEDDFKLLPDALNEICINDPCQRLLVLNYPNNPTGLSYDQSELKALAEVARQHRILVLSDEIYGDIHHQNKHSSIASFYPEGSIISSGLSKWCGAGGWRLGFFSFPEALSPITAAMATAASETFTSTAAPIQYAAVTAYRDNKETEEYLRRSRVILRDLSAWITHTLRLAGARVVNSDGGFYLFPDFSAYRQHLAKRNIYCSTMLCERLLEEAGVAILPGSDFGREPLELTVRLAYVDFDGQSALNALGNASQANESFLKTHCSNVLLGIQKLCEWIQM